MPVRVSGSYIVQSWDTAIRTDERNSYSVCITLLVQGTNYYVLDVFRGRLEFPELRVKAGELSRTYKPDQIVVEDSGFGQALMHQLKNLAMVQSRSGPRGAR